ncbi:GTP-binding protein rbg1 [Friedmanniomyces endolithicus]|nr:GTP-binding protein rbg1 [Friedmanniomyces endolithicus]
MATTVDKIKHIEDEMAKTQKNKATSFHLGQLKAKLAKLKKELLNPTVNGGSGAGVGFDVARTGVASVGFIGFPSVGKSTLMSRITGQHSEAAAYEFTTLTTVPGQVLYNGAKIQMLDLPGIIQGAKDGKGRGRQVIAVAKTCNLIFIVLDVNKPLTDKRVIETELEGFGIRINKEPPNIKITKKDKGGISITSTVNLSHIDNDEVKAVMNEYRMANCDIAIRCDATIDDLIDVIEAKSRSYIPVIYALNKIDAISIEELDLLYRIPNACPISSEHGWNVDELMEQMWDKLRLKRIYTKPKGKLPDYSAPVVLKDGRETVEDFCNAIHKTIVEQFRIAIVYGKSPVGTRGDAHGMEDRSAKPGWLETLENAADLSHICGMTDHRSRTNCQRAEASSTPRWSRGAAIGSGGRDWVDSRRDPIQAQGERMQSDAPSILVDVELGQYAVLGSK